MPGDVPRVQLPDRPPQLAERPVVVWREPVTIPTYRPLPPDRYPAYLHQRVYQGSSGRVYPLPFHDRIALDAEPVSWDAVHLENEWLRVMVLPGLGGRIHVVTDRTTGYEVFYRNDAIKPALVGLAGPWVAGGVEFNWPQHHRPATFLPVDVQLEESDDGSVVVWCSDHDPFTRMKGMHGVRLHPDRAVLQLDVRLYNRSEEQQTFLWWANVAARAHDDYQSFFPGDVRLVADHARRAVTGFPAADRPYYGVDYPARHDEQTIAADGSRHAGDRIDWYRNIPVPTSYMCVGSAGEFFGGYDHAAAAGFVHVADRRIAVGKKQWTWGNAPFGHAWERNLADDGAHYVELMAGVFTDNQPDFSWLAPGETKVFSQFWYPIQHIGPACAATVEAAVSLRPCADGLTVGVVVTRVRERLTIEVLDAAGRVIARTVADAGPGRPVLWTVPLPAGTDPDDVAARVLHRGVELVAPGPDAAPGPAGDATVAVSTEPPDPADVPTVEELFLIGQHLQQYRHATRPPEPYWREALARDPGHAGANTALAGRAYRSGRYAEAEASVRRAIARLTAWNANPTDSAPHYLLGLVLQRTGDIDGAYDAFGRALWNRAWRAPAGYRMALLDAAAGRDGAALARVEDVLRTEPEHLQARDLAVVVLRRLGRTDEAADVLARTLRLDPLDWWARDLAGHEPDCDAQTCVDVALDHARAGQTADALRLLDLAARRDPDRASGAPAVGPLARYHEARLRHAAGDIAAAASAMRAALESEVVHCFPGRLDDADVLAAVVEAHPDDPLAPALLGHWLYAQDRPDDAVAAWRRAVDLDPGNAVAWRSLGLAAHNHAGDPALARRCYDRALAAAPDDARLLFESDQLDQRLGADPAERLRRLTARPDLVAARDDATVELAHLHLGAADPDAALALLAGRRFQPWEGGEGQVLAVWDRLHLALARRALAAGDPPGAVAAVDAALDPPSGLGEQRHPLANPSALHLMRGDAAALAGDHDEAEVSWRAAAAVVGDFVAMVTQPYSEASYPVALAHRRVGETDAADTITAGLAAWCDELVARPARADYFATSLPTLLLFTTDPAVTVARRVTLLCAQVDVLEGRPEAAARRLAELLDVDPAHHAARDLFGDLRDGIAQPRAGGRRPGPTPRTVSGVGRC